VIAPDGTQPHGKIRLTASATLRQAIAGGLDARGSPAG
jgi:hypothetical protein